MWRCQAGFLETLLVIELDPNKLISPLMYISSHWQQRKYEPILADVNPAPSAPPVPLGHSFVLSLERNFLEITLGHCPFYVIPHRLVSTVRRKTCSSLFELTVHRSNSEYRSTWSYRTLLIGCEALIFRCNKPPITVGITNTHKLRCLTLCPLPSPRRPLPQPHTNTTMFRAKSRTIPEACQ